MYTACSTVEPRRSKAVKTVSGAGFFLIPAASFSPIDTGSSSPKYLWILSRTPALPRPTLVEILRRAAERGYDTTRLQYVPQGKNLK